MGFIPLPGWLFLRIRFWRRNALSLPCGTKRVRSGGIIEGWLGWIHIVKKCGIIIFKSLKKLLTLVFPKFNLIMFVLPVTAGSVSVFILLPKRLLRLKRR